METAGRLHAEDYLLVTPRGVTLSKSEYLRAVETGDLTYQRFEAVSEMLMLTGDGSLAVLRYMSAIEVSSPGGTFCANCWHMDCYRRGPTAGWQAVWLQATATEPEEA